MRITVFVYLAMLFLLVEVQGVHLKHGLLSQLGHHQKVQEEKESKLTEADQASAGEVIRCKDGQCSGRTRKLLIDHTSTSTTSTISTSKKVTKSDEGTSKSISSNKQLKGNETQRREVAPERYPDIIDIAGMDYSTAKRKPPIHN